MIDSSTRRGSRRSAVLLFASIAVLLVATGCKSTKTGPANPSITVKESRSAGGPLQGLTISGKGFDTSGPVHLTFLLEGLGTSQAPYVEVDTKADSSGKLKYERKPMDCPQATGYGTAVWTTVVARDTNTGISATVLLHPGTQPDCKG